MTSLVKALHFAYCPSLQLVQIQMCNFQCATSNVQLPMCNLCNFQCATCATSNVQLPLCNVCNFKCATSNVQLVQLPMCDFKCTTSNVQLVQFMFTFISLAFARIPASACLMRLMHSVCAPCRHCHVCMSSGYCPLHAWQVHCHVCPLHAWQVTTGTVPHIRRR